MKILKRILWVLLFLVAAVILLTYIYKDTLVKRLVNNYNKNLNVTITYKNADLSIFKRFPHAEISIDNLTLINNDIATKDTLLMAKKVFFAMNVEELFKKNDEIITFKDLLIDNATVNLITNEKGFNNFDIHTIKKELKTINDTIKSPKFNINIKKYRLTNTNFNYNNKTDQSFIKIKNLNHSGSGDFSANKTDLITNTSADAIQANFAGFSYNIPKKVTVNANLGVDFEKSKVVIQDLIIENANLSIVSNPIKNKSKKIKNTSKSKIQFDLKKYTLKNNNINYYSKADNIELIFKNVNHNGKGVYANNTMDLFTKTLAKEVTIKVGEVTYISKSKIDLDAVLGIDFDKLKFTLKDNKGKINDLDLVFNGFVDVNDNQQEIDIKFHSPKAQFKSILSLIPNAYSSSFNDVTALGVADVTGVIKGINAATSFPKYNIHIKTSNASFKYPNLPKAVKNIFFDGAIVSTSKKNNVFLDIKNAKFSIDKDTFEVIGKITDLISNPTVDAAFKGTLNLGNLSQAYPIKMDKKLTGILTANFKTKVNQHDIETNQYSKIKTNGTATLTNFNYMDKDIAKPIFVKKASIKFKTNQILLTHFDAKTGDSDIKATGNLDNLFAFLFNDKKLKGNFDVTSNLFKVSDFLIDESKNNTLAKGSENGLKIPAFLNVNTKLTAKKVIYDNLILEHVSGLMKLKNQVATISNSKAKMLDGNITFNGNVDTKKEPATFDLDVVVTKFDIANSFNTLETFQKLVPIAKAVKGKYNSTFKLKGFLNANFSPNINSLNGDAFAQLFVNDINKNGLPLLNELTSKLKFINFDQLDLSNLKTLLKFANGNVNVDPFDLKYKDITVHISGSHGFDKSLKYNLAMDIPAKYLGTEAVNLLSKLTNIDKDTIKIPLATNIRGTLTKPKVNVDFKAAMNSLALKVIKYQKEALANQVSETANQTIDSILSQTGIDSIIPVGIDSIIDIKGGVKDVINDILNGNKKK